MYACVYVENYSRDEENELTLARAIIADCSRSECIPAVFLMTRRYAAAGNVATSTKRDFSFFKSAARAAELHEQLLLKSSIHI